ncbi:MAG: hypothetical protein K6E18_05060 [Lachnospiraceae bacterium]|nr:hypothetical protein [Lachnospiraceae bacterium]
MTKNIIVTDINGNVTGTTYPKRARGLIKSGRATEVDEHTIRLISSVFTDAFSFETEETKMANIIDFKARGFKLVPECTSNRGTRLIVTENEENVECFEIGEGGMMTEIARKVELQKDQDYVFRFTIKSRFVRGENAESMVSIYFDEKGDGYTYPLDRADKNRFKPVICKKTDDGLLRVFELPFNSGDSESCTIDVSVHDMTAWLYPAKEADAYSALEDIDYDQWRQDELHRVAKYLSDIGGSIGETMVETLSGFGKYVGKAGDKLAKTVSDVINRPSSSDAEKEKTSDEDIEEEVILSEETDDTDAKADEGAPAAAPTEAVAPAAEAQKKDSEG